jgi:spermidine synthase
VLDTARLSDGRRITLARDGDVLELWVDERMLMSSVAHGSEEEMAYLGCAGLERARKPRVLVGGLGLGYTLRATLDALPPSAEVVVGELLAPIVRWHREGPLGALAADPLDDPRVELRTGDVKKLLDGAEDAYDAILLDVDNGPEALVQAGNGWLYGDAGLAAIVRALRRDGTVVIWSGFPDRGFTARMRAAGLDTQVVRTGAQRRTDRDWTHWLFVGRRGSIRRNR